MTLIQKSPPKADPPPAQKLKIQNFESINPRVGESRKTIWHYCVQHDLYHTRRKALTGRMICCSLGCPCFSEDTRARRRASQISSRSLCSTRPIDLLQPVSPVQGGCSQCSQNEAGRVPFG